MPELTYKTKIAAVFKKMESGVLGTMENPPGYISITGDGTTIRITLNTERLPHGVSAREGVHDMAAALVRHFGEGAVRVDELRQDPVSRELGLPPDSRLTLTIPDNHTSLGNLMLAHRDVAIDYCRKALAGQPDEQVEYLNSQLGSGVQAAFDEMVERINRDTPPVGANRLKPEYFTRKKVLVGQSK